MFNLVESPTLPVQDADVPIVRSRREDPMAQVPGMSSGELRALLTIEEVAQRLGVSVRHVRRLVLERRIPYLKWGHLIRFDPLDVQSFVGAARVEVGHRPPSRAPKSHGKGRNH
jgi:excisionase family DNA binding protein